MRAHTGVILGTLQQTLDHSARDGGQRQGPSERDLAAVVPPATRVRGVPSTLETGGRVQGNTRLRLVRT